MSFSERDTGAIDYCGISSKTWSGWRGEEHGGCAVERDGRRRVDRCARLPPPQFANLILCRDPTIFFPPPI